MRLEITVPEENVGDVIGDLNSRRGRVARHGARPAARPRSMPRCRWRRCSAYAPDLTSMTGGRGDYAMSFLRYEEVPAHVAQQADQRRTKEKELAKA